jgi:plastocyanin
MSRLFGVFFAILACALAACGGQNGSPSTQSPPGQSGVMALPPIDGDLAVTATLPKHTIGEDLPSTALGSMHSAKWKAWIGGFTQSTYSQVLGFAPGTKITIRNLSRTTVHTFNVVAVIGGPPAKFPKHPKLSFTASGGKLEKGYASGLIKPGHSVSVVLVKGIYLVGCAFHYSIGMRDVLVVEDGAKPGPESTPSPSPTPAPTTTPSPAPSSSGSPGPSPSSSTSPSPTAPAVMVSPSSVNVCAKTTPCTTSGYPNSVPVTVSQSGYTGNITEAFTGSCPWVAVSPTAAPGPTPSPFTVKGIWTGANGTWTCTARFTGEGGQTGSVTIHSAYP